MKQSRGLRNNNPLNIRRTNTIWQGMKTEVKDKSFVEFKTLPYGYRAAWKTLDTYYKIFERECKPYTVRNIIARWAPHNENDTENYVRIVSRLSGLGGNEHVPRPQRDCNYDELEKTVRMIAAMTCVENGIDYKDVDMDAIWLGYDLAFGGRKNGKKKNVPSGSKILLNPKSIPVEIIHTSPWLDEYWDWSPEAFGR